MPFISLSVQQPPNVLTSLSSHGFKHHLPNNSDAYCSIRRAREGIKPYLADSKVYLAEQRSERLLRGAKSGPAATDSLQRHLIRGL